MENDDPMQVMWREGELRCELWDTGAVSELRVYFSSVLRYREPVFKASETLRQAASLLNVVQGSWFRL